MGFTLQGVDVLLDHFFPKKISVPRTPGKHYRLLPREFIPQDLTSYCRGEV